MVIYIFHQNRLEGKALAQLLQNLGIRALTKEDYWNKVDGKLDLIISEPEIFLNDISAFNSNKYTDYPPHISDYGNYKSALMGELSHLHNFLNATDELDGYFSKKVSVMELVNGIEKLNNGKVYLCQKVKNFLENDRLTQQQILLDSKINKSLSTTEIKILYKISNGKTTKEIASDLYRSVHTINNHRKNAMSKLTIKGTFSLTMFATTYRDEIKTLKAIDDQEEVVEKILGYDIEGNY